MKNSINMKSVVSEIHRFMGILKTDPIYIRLSDELTTALYTDKKAYEIISINNKKYVMFPNTPNEKYRFRILYSTLDYGSFERIWPNILIFLKIISLFGRIPLIVISSDIFAVIMGIIVISFFVGWVQAFNG